MAQLLKNAFTVILMAFTLSCYIMITPTVANNVDNMKNEIRGEGNAENTISAGNTPNTANLFGSKRNLRSIYGIGPKMLQISRSKIPIELDLLVENEDGERSKRFDDYGHMRFGKRGGEEQFDDYGHMRFGRST